MYLRKCISTWNLWNRSLPPTVEKLSPDGLRTYIQKQSFKTDRSHIDENHSDLGVEKNFLSKTQKILITKKWLMKSTPLKLKTSAYQKHSYEKQKKKKLKMGEHVYNIYSWNVIPFSLSTHSFIFRVPINEKKTNHPIKKWTKYTTSNSLKKKAGRANKKWRLSSLISNDENVNQTAEMYVASCQFDWQELMYQAVLPWI